MDTKYEIVVFTPSGSTYVGEVDADSGDLVRLSSQEVRRKNDDYVDPLTGEVLTDQLIEHWLDHDPEAADNAAYERGSDYSLVDAGHPVIDRSHPREL